MPVECAIFSEHHSKMQSEKRIPNTVERCLNSKKNRGIVCFTCASWNSKAAISIPISSAFVNNRRQAEALVVSKRGIFWVGTEQKKKWNETMRCLFEMRGLLILTPWFIFNWFIANVLITVFFQFTFNTLLFKTVHETSSVGHEQIKDPIWWEFQSFIPSK